MEAKKQKYSEAKTELEFPFPMHIINEIIPQPWLLAHYVKISALRICDPGPWHWQHTHTTENIQLYQRHKAYK